MSEEKEMSFLDHLEELRWHLVRSVIAVFVFAVTAFVMKDFVWGTLILGPTRPDFFTFRLLCRLGEITGMNYFCIEELDFVIQSRKVTGQFTMHLTSSFVIGIICAFPYAFWEFWHFISPGLYERERRVSRGAVFFVSVLFISGVLFGYYVITPLSFNFMVNYKVAEEISNEFDITYFVTFVTTLVLACGILFQIPVVTLFLSKAGIVTPQFLRRYRKHAIVIILFVAAVLTPPDVISQILIAIPLTILYEFSISISARVEKKRLQDLES
ncbi:twin-arginine translocase subunit TatC [Fulvivirgaceae bacterium BMA12]|uniref:Sec-independent protein translocase protein TatC n=1 Tax=Agaribacillus aureus TaxID=3051825 RepID=A0ABT8LHL4_9BACT|nr:twin-arginine translocase subunit TatC [Fulvivirgaceae bacterium BMA12]